MRMKSFQKDTYSQKLNAYGCNYNLSYYKESNLSKSDCLKFGHENVLKWTSNWPSTIVGSQSWAPVHCCKWVQIPDCVTT